VKLAKKLLFQPWKWKGGNEARNFEQNFARWLGVKYAFSFNSGRSALYAILKALELPEHSNVMLQAFTCNAVVNPILWEKLNPVYVDCSKEDFNIDLTDLEKKLAPENKVLIVQHTFGMPANMQAIERLAADHGLTIIEDCAHALGAEYGGRKVGTFGKAAFFSFSRDKVISSVYGGMATTNDDALGKKLEQLQKEFGYPSLFWTRQQILHPILLSYIILPLYNFLDLGKLFLIFSQWLHVLSKAVSWKEKRGLRPDYFPKALPNALAIMAQHQFSKLEVFNQHRQEVAKQYYQELQGTSFLLPKQFENRNNIFLRFAVRHQKAHEIIYEAWHNQNILLGDWYTTPIAPDDTKFDAMKYKMGMCPNAESLAKETLNLPTHITIGEKEAKRITDFLKKYK